MCTKAAYVIRPVDSALSECFASSIYIVNLLCLSVDVKMSSEEPQRANQSLIIGVDLSDKSKSTLLSQVR